MTVDSIISTLRVHGQTKRRPGAVQQRIVDAPAHSKRQPPPTPPHSQQPHSPPKRQRNAGAHQANHTGGARIHAISQQRNVTRHVPMPALPIVSACCEGDLLQLSLFENKEGSATTGAKLTHTFLSLPLQSRVTGSAKVWVKK